MQWPGSVHCKRRPASPCRHSASWLAGVSGKTRTPHRQGCWVSTLNNQQSFLPVNPALCQEAHGASSSTGEVWCLLRAGKCIKSRLFLMCCKSLNLIFVRGVLWGLVGTRKQIGFSESAALLVVETPSVLEGRLWLSPLCLPGVKAA